MSPHYFIKQNDDSPPIRSTLLDASGAGVPLTGASVLFVMTKRGEASPTVAAVADIDEVDDEEETIGKVSYQWQEGDTSEPGPYFGEWQVDFAGGERQTFPNSGFIHIQVVADLGDGEVSA